MSVHAIVVAAGRGVRAGADLPKQWRLLAGRPVLRWTVEALFAAGVDFHVPFGGRKASSYGPKEQGTYAKEFFTQVKIAYTAAG